MKKSKDNFQKIVPLNEHGGWFARSIEKVMRRGTQEESQEVARCIRSFRTSFEHANCLYPVFARGNQIKRISILHTLARWGKKGYAVLHVLLQASPHDFKGLFADYLLAYAARRPNLPGSILASCYQEQKAVFRKAFARIDKYSRLLATERLIKALKLRTPKMVNDEFQGYVILPLQWLWQHIWREKDFYAALPKINLLGCTTGSSSEPANVKKLVEKLRQLDQTWFKLSHLLERSGLNQYFHIIRSLQKGKVSVVALPKIQPATIQKAYKLSEHHQLLRAEITEELKVIKNPQKRERLNEWFGQITAQSASFYQTK